MTARMQPISAIYVTRDLERASGIAFDTPGYVVITNAQDPFAQEMATRYKQIHLIPSDALLDTHALLSHPKTQEIIATQEEKNIVVFKPTKRIKDICLTHGWTLRNPDPALASEVEEKISQLHWLGTLARYLPPHHIQNVEDIMWGDIAFIVQFNRAHTGSGTILISSKHILDELQNKFPKRPARVSAFIDGYTITSNNVVTTDGSIVHGNISYQITGIAPFTTQPFATIGNDFALPHRLLTKEQRLYFAEMVNAIGKKLADAGWKGAFGIDVMVEKSTGTLYLLEINARQPASVAFESTLQTTADPHGLTIFDAHLLSLLGQTLPTPTVTSITQGAQLVLRQQEEPLPIHDIQQALTDVTCIPYANTKAERDILRIQTTKHFMEDDNVLSKQGRLVQDTILTLQRHS